MKNRNIVYITLKVLMFCIYINFKLYLEITSLVILFYRVFSSSSKYIALCVCVWAIANMERPPQHDSCTNNNNINNMVHIRASP